MALFTSRKQQKDIKVTFSNGLLHVETDGKTQAYPLDWYPQLLNATDEERADWTLTNNGIHFNKLNIDFSL
ncbi:DUF2442 domain-containing protein [Mucilaginibacter limnophilus]|uniref:DUF2442 domain-containing protein n=1 Tax=Mucilaginibacter limnophilus TaxID=1932778 RepID=A0A3S2UZE5_9SPHI|nr:DUF2442 domain-containing protein [Mucilaginibacter limnophilus]RVT96481.1 DUF2442 domain-containing protein [Mucilaginibacter limnophilus]